MCLLGTKDTSFLVLEDLNDTLGTYCKVLLVELFWILGRCHDQIVWTELGWAHDFTVAVEELYRHI